MKNISDPEKKQKLIDALNEGGIVPSGEVWRYSDVDPATGDIGGRGKTTWQDGKSRYAVHEFKIDKGFRQKQLDATQNLRDYFDRLTPAKKQEWLQQYPELRTITDTGAE